MKLLSARLVFMNEGPAHMFTRGNQQIPDDLDGNRWPVMLGLNNDYSFHHQGGSVVYNGLIGQTWPTALVWLKAKWPVRRYGWKDKEVTWEGSLFLNGSPWTPEDDDLSAEDWMIGGNGEEGGGDPGTGPALTSFLVNGVSFGITSGFPTFLFEGAKFKILASRNATWTSSNDNAEVTNGEVTIKKRGDFSIRATASNGLFSEFHFTDKKWLIPSPDQIKHEGGADFAWITQQGGRLPTALESTTAPLIENSYPKERGVGTITSEWGDLSVFGWRKWRNSNATETEYFPTSTVADQIDTKWFIGVQNGKITRIGNTNSNSFTPVALIEPSDPSSYQVSLEGSYNQGALSVTGRLITTGLPAGYQIISVNISGWKPSTTTVRTDSDGYFIVPNIYQNGQVTLNVDVRTPEGDSIPAQKIVPISGFDQPAPWYMIGSIKTEDLTYPNGLTYGVQRENTPYKGTFISSASDLGPNPLLVSLWSNRQYFQNGSYYQWLRIIFLKSSLSSAFYSGTFKLKIQIGNNIYSLPDAPTIGEAAGNLYLSWNSNPKELWEDLKSASEFTRIYLQFTKV